VNDAKCSRIILTILIVQYSGHVQRAFKCTQLVNTKSRNFNMWIKLHHAPA